MTDLIRGSALNGAPELIDRLGAAPADLSPTTATASVPLGGADRFVPFSSVSDTVGRWARELQAPDFALRLAATQDIGVLGPLAVMARTAGTVGDALRGIVRFTHAYSPALATSLHVGDRRAAYELVVLPSRLQHRAHVVELALAFTARVIRALGGPECRIASVHSQHGRMGTPGTYAEHFGCHVEFDAGRNLLELPADALDLRLPGADPAAHDLAVRYLALQHAEPSFLDAVAAAIRSALPAGEGTLEAVSEGLLTHPRTLQRKLARTGSTFESLADTVRRDVADELLADEDLPLATVARRLGYTEQSSLTRSCRRWFGQTPQTRRHSA